MTDNSITLRYGANGTTVAMTADGRRLDIRCGQNPADACSPNELLHAALGSCIVASIVPLLRRHDISTERLAVSIRPSGSVLPDALLAEILLPPVDENMLLRCRRAAENCPVLKSLATPVEVRLTME